MLPCWPPLFKERGEDEHRYNISLCWGVRRGKEQGRETRLKVKAIFANVPFKLRPMPFIGSEAGKPLPAYIKISADKPKSLPLKFNRELSGEGLVAGK